MNIGLATRLLKNLANSGHKQLANKLWAALKVGKPINLKPDERKAFELISDALTGRSSEIATSVGKGVKVRRGAFYNKRKGTFGPSVFSEHKNTPIIDIDLNDPLSHYASQVTHHTLKDFKPALMDFLKMPGGQHSALKIYRTPAGMRIFDVSKKHRGIRPEVYEGAMRDLGADGAFIRHSKVTDSYNARLFPKPGRTHNIWGLPGNKSNVGPLKDWDIKNPGDFVAKQVNPGYILKGKKAIVDEQSLAETVFHDKVIQQIINRKNAKGVIKVNNLLDLVTF